MNCYADIETLPTLDAAAISEIAAGVTPPGNMSKPETIAAWETEKKPGLIEAATRDTALDGGSGRILAIAYAFADDAPAVAIHPDNRTDLADAYEYAILEDFFKAIESRSRILGTPNVGEYLKDICFIGHNISGFDLRFIWQRAVVHGLKPPVALRRAAVAKPWNGELVADTMLLWNPDKQRRISMKRLCAALKVPSPKTDLDGSKIYDAWKAGELDRIEAYAKEEIRALRACHRKMLFLETA